jgi:fumarylpyruvate hydrolase
VSKKLAAAIKAPEQVTLPIAGTDEYFPVRRIHCIGRNYVAHVREMGGNEDRDPPLFFQKPGDSVIQDGGTVPYPTITSDFHHEIELVLAMKGGGYNIPVETASEHIYGYAIGLDMTRRDLQSRTGQPWEIAKGFDRSSPVGPIHTVESVGRIESGKIALTVNGKVTQESDIDLLIWKIPEIISNLSQYFEIMPGDLIMTGTPHGVGPVQVGDTLVGSIDKLGTLTVTIGPKAG